MISGPHPCAASMLRNQRIGIEAWRCSGRHPGRRLGNQGPASRRHRERDVSRRASGCGGRDSHHEIAQNAGHNRLRPPGLETRRTPRRVLLPCVRLDCPSLRIEGDRPPQRPRLGVGEGAGSYGLRHLTRLRSPAAPSFMCLGHGGPNNAARSRSLIAVPCRIPNLRSEQRAQPVSNGSD
jgi:hypothetical protein